MSSAEIFKLSGAAFCLVPPIGGHVVGDRLVLLFAALKSTTAGSLSTTSRKATVVDSSGGMIDHLLTISVAFGSTTRNLAFTESAKTTPTH